MPVKKIAFVCPRFPDGTVVGGAETLIKNIAIKTAQAGIEVTYLTTCAKNHFTWKNEIPEGIKKTEGIEVRFFPVNEDRDIESFLSAQESISRGKKVSEEEEKIWLDNNVNSRALCRHLEEEGKRYDAVVAGPYLFGLIYHAVMTVPDRAFIIPCLHDEPFAYLNVFKKMFNSARGIIFNTEPEENLALSIFNINPSITSVVGMGLDDFHVKNPFTLPDNKPYIIYSGRREIMKGSSLLIDYFSTYRERTGRDLQLVLTGSGEITPDIETAPHVKDMGFVTEEKKHELMSGAIAFCHPSINESLGIVLLESWLAGTPALVHAQSEVLVHQCSKSRGGLWFATYPEFEEELSLLMNNTELRSQMAKNGRNYVLSEYSWKNILPKFMDAVEKQT